MYLKSIEIQGFKSFANKIVFEFHNGITGIVGPNGSGKSNVADAVRWVLGEQRIKQLRGGTMQDVIFAGTEVRKPQGFAFVAITLDNSDHQLPIEFDQVTVSRRLYRSGESEYKLNGSACRLKDVNELFYDTGIGKEGYSIIGQGQIDKILSGKPEERRELFDEAAGIVKYKRRKIIAQKKLEDEKQNLVRVNDILSELEKQVGPLAKQSEAAREYLKLKEELKILDANLFLMEMEAMLEQQKQVDSRISVVSGDLETARGEAGALKEEYDKICSQIEELDDLISGNREEQSQNELKKGGLDGRINVLMEQINTERMNAEHIQNRMNAIDSELESKKGQRAGYENERAVLKEQLAEITRRLAAAGEELALKEQGITSLEQSIEDSKAQMIGALNEKAGLAAKRQRYETMLEQVDVRRSEVSQKLLKFKTDEFIQEEQLKEEKERLSGIEERLSELSEKEKELTARLSEEELQERRLNKNLNSCQQDYHTCNTKLESLKNLAERYDGYGGSIRRVMEVRDRVYGIHGVVADLISASRDYEVAIETALGGSIQNIVTDSEQTAKQLIEYLKKNKYGRATFLPLTGIGNKNTFNQPQALKEPGVLGLASDLVTVDRQYEGLAKYLLGRVIVVDEIDHAIALAAKYRHTLRIVTLEGELLNAGGSMTGGAFKNSSNLLGRRREIEELELSCQKTLKAVEQIQKDILSNEAVLKETRGELEAVREERQDAKLRQTAAQMNLAQIQARRQEITDSSSDLVAENRELEEQLKEIRDSQNLLEQDTVRLEQINDQKNQEIEARTIELEQAKAEREELSSQLSGVQLEEAGIRQKDSFVGENLGRIREEIQRFEKERESLSHGSGHSGLAIEEKLKEIEELKRQIREAEERNSALTELAAGKLKEKEEKSILQKSFFEKQEALSDRVSSLDKDLFRLQSQKEKLDEKREEAAGYMWSEYELTFSSAEKLRNGDCASIQGVKRQIEELRGKIKALGNVNVNAIEDYKEISERYDFMKNQHEDLIAAEAALTQIIGELDTGMRRQFAEKFAEIQREFDKVFKELFGGGHGTLELQQEEDILEAGVQIISQPPGKKLQNMMQLSGGEKALTAIALLFAIQNLKPSPFCLLDEIEAALDDSNVDRFAGYLHKLTRHTQFIVITHRRGTMVASDRLYGITMQEKGVSTLVSVNLIESELEKE